MYVLLCVLHLCVIKDDDDKRDRAKYSPLKTKA